MSKQTHTPGPWESVGGPGFDQAIYAANIPIAVVHVGKNNPDGEANVRLIIAASDLLAALRSCACPRPANERPDHWTVEQCYAHGECGCDCGAAIAKAIEGAP
jgi:hypothetical protein